MNRSEWVDWRIIVGRRRWRGVVVGVSLGWWCLRVKRGIWTSTTSRKFLCTLAFEHSSYIRMSCASTDTVLSRRPADRLSLSVRSDSLASSGGYGWHGGDGDEARAQASRVRSMSLSGRRGFCSAETYMAECQNWIHDRNLQLVRRSNHQIDSRTPSFISTLLIDRFGLPQMLCVTSHYSVFRRYSSKLSVRSTVDVVHYSTLTKTASENSTRFIRIFNASQAEKLRIALLKRIRRHN